MKNVCRTISLLLLCAMVLTIGFPFGASAATEKNEWRGIEWEYDTLIDAVTIHCEGVVPVSKDMPWKDRAGNITAFVFDRGVTEIPAGFSDGCVNMDAIKVPATTRSIGEGVLTVGNLEDVWYEGSWEGFTQIEMSAEDFAAAEKARFHGSRIEIGEDGSVAYVEEKEGGEGGVNLPEPIKRDESIVEPYNGEYDPITCKALDYSYPSRYPNTVDGKNCTIYVMKDGSYLYVFEDGQIVIGDSGYDTDEGRITYHSDGTRTVDLISKNDGSRRTVFIEPLGTKTISTTTNKADLTRTFLLLDARQRPTDSIQDGNTTVYLVGDDPNVRDLVRETTDGDVTTTLTERANGTNQLKTTEPNKETVIEFDKNGDTTKTTETVYDPEADKTTVTVDVTDGPTTVTEYNGEGEEKIKTKETVTEGNTETVTEYDGTAAENVTKTTETVYDPEADKTTVTEDVTDGPTTVTEYNGKGDEKIKTRETVTEPDGTETVTNFEADGTTPKDITVTEPDGTETVTEYENGTPTKETVTEPDGTETVTNFEADGTTPKDKTVTEPDGTKTVTEYENGTPTKETEKRADDTTSKETVYNKDGTKTVTDFDEEGNKKEKTEYDAQGEVTQETEYDAQGEVTKNIEYKDDGKIVTTEYNVPSPKGPLTKVTTKDGDFEEVHYYNAEGQETYPGGSPIVA